MLEVLGPHGEDVPTDFRQSLTNLVDAIGEFMEGNIPVDVAEAASEFIDAHSDYTTTIDGEEDLCHIVKV